MRWKLIGYPVFYLADFSSWVWYGCLYTISYPATATEIPGVLASYFLWWIRLDPTPSLFTWRAFHKAADITLHVDLQCNFCFRLGSVLASSWWLGTKEEFHGWHHLVEDVIVKTQSQHVHSGPLSVLQTCTLPDICTLSTNFGHSFSLLWLCTDIRYLYPLIPSQLPSYSLHLHPHPALQLSLFFPWIMLAVLNSFSF